MQVGDVLRFDVSCGAESAATAQERVDQRVWHNQKWGSTLELPLAEGAVLELAFAQHPVITQPLQGASM